MMVRDEFVSLECHKVKPNPKCDGFLRQVLWVMKSSPNDTKRNQRLLFFPCDRTYKDGQKIALMYKMLSLQSL